MPERLQANSQVLVPIDCQAVEGVVDQTKVTRFNSVAVGLLHSYVNDAHERVIAQVLANEGATCPVFLMHSGGGIISIEYATESLVRLVESGPAGGAVFAAHIAARHGLDKVLSFDMCDATAKICLNKNQTQEPRGCSKWPAHIGSKRGPACRFRSL